MKLLIQRVVRAAVEVDGFVESRIGQGIVVTLAVAEGDTEAQAEQLAAKVVQLKLWPELTDLEKPFKSTVVENGFEILVILQPSLLATFGRSEPNEQAAMSKDEAKQVYTAFVAKLQAEYQSEMILTASTDENIQVEMMCESPCVYTLDREVPSAQKALATRAAVSTAASLTELEPDVGMVTKALQQIPMLAKSKATLESCRVFRMFGMKKFRNALADSMQAEADDFAEALSAAGRYFSKSQLEQISGWTGLTISAASREDAEDEEEEQDDMDEAQENLDEQLALLQEEIDNPELARKRKREMQLKEAAMARSASAGPKAVKDARPDLRGRAAPNTPAAAAARQWAASRAGVRPYGGYGGKGRGGKGVGWGKGGGRTYRNWGIASLDESARLHGNDPTEFQWNQHARVSDKEARFLKMKAEDPEAEDEEEETLQPAKKRTPAPMPRLQKGIPTLAPMTPAPADMNAEL